MTWAEFAGSGAHNWMIVAGLVLVTLTWVRAIRLERAKEEDEVGDADPILVDQPDWQALEAKKNARANRLGYEREALHA